MVFILKLELDIKMNEVNEIYVDNEVKIKIHKVNLNNPSEKEYYSNELQKLENLKDFTYPLGNETFCIKHGLGENNSYFDFFNQLGNNVHYVILHKQQIIGTICLIYRNCRNYRKFEHYINNRNLKNHSKQINYNDNYFYICDYKILKEFRGKNITKKLFNKLFKENIRISNKFMFVNMVNPNQQQNKNGLINKAKMLFSIFNVHEKPLYLYEMQLMEFKEFLNQNNLDENDYFFFSNDGKKDIFISNQHHPIIHAINKNNINNMQDWQDIEVKLDSFKSDSHIMFTSFEKLKTTNPLIQESEAKIVSNLKNIPLISSGEI